MAEWIHSASDFSGGALLINAGNSPGEWKGIP